MGDAAAAAEGPFSLFCSHVDLHSASYPPDFLAVSDRKWPNQGRRSSVLKSAAFDV
jgi:hypothetical protein